MALRIGSNTTNSVGPTSISETSETAKTSPTNESASSSVQEKQVLRSGGANAFSEVRGVDTSVLTREELLKKVTVSKKEIASDQNQDKQPLEMGELDSLALQMKMDRKAKLSTTISNLLDKLADTTDSIIKKIK